MWRGIFKRIAQLIVVSPKAWKRIGKENISLNEFLNKFLHPLFGIIALTSFIGGLWFSVHGSLENALKQSLIRIVAVYGGYFISSYVINELAPRFGLKKNISLFRKFAGYASVVIYVLYIITPFISGFFIIWLLALYTIKLVYAGAQYYIKVNTDNRVNFSLAASGLIIFVPALIQLFLSYSIK